eukprot:TRINITY_DN3414_c0_g1_i2.p1 TRINITY_DN3414_c0_g1~~TRINITY_DN3414_c0_g1_i2.p1  ORF type:complete len:420 (-),score=32.15 TRINITY_DN3414_c0_g1_i2:41-1234(-)
MSDGKPGCGAAVRGVLSYSTAKMVDISNWKLGVLYYIIVIGILGFVCGYQIWWKKGYQREIPLIGDANVKAKGTAFMNSTDGPVVWDAMDVVFPPKETNAIFLTTNVQSTLNQTQGLCVDTSQPCDGDICIPLANRTSDGIPTGRCINGSCEVRGWCQVEQAIEPLQLYNFLYGVEDFSLFVRVTVNFYEAAKQVIFNNGDSGLVNGTNLFYVGNLTSWAGADFDKVRQVGAVFAMMFHWECDLDGSTYCQPNIAMARLDNPVYNKITSGFNFRYARYYYKQNSTGAWSQYRDLYKVYGVRFIFMVSGLGRAFDLATTMTTVGSGLALMSVATVATDIFVLYLIPKRKLYRGVKYEDVDGSTFDPLAFESEAESDAEAPSRPTSRANERTPLRGTSE